MSDYTNEPQQRILRLLTLLSGNEITGLAPADIARQQGCAASMVTRDVDNLIKAGFAELVPETSRVRLAPHLIQIATRYQVAIARASDRLAETRSRYSRE